MATRFVSYLRVSTARQGQSGLGIEAQRSAVAAVIGTRGELVREFVEVESGTHDDRQELLAAITYAKAQKACLIAAKVDRMGRHAAKLLSVLDDAHKSGLEIVFADAPGANMLLLGVMVLVAQDEAERISKRTKDALQAARDRGQKLGGHRPGAFGEAGCGPAALRQQADDRAARLRLTIKGCIADGATTLHKIADRLNQEGIATARDGSWHPSSVSRLLSRLDIKIAA